MSFAQSCKQAVRKVVFRSPKLYQKQTDAFFDPLDADGNPAPYSWIEGSTKSGKTVSCIAKDGREFWWVAPVLGTSKIVIKR